MEPKDDDPKGKPGDDPKKDDPKKPEKIEDLGLTDEQQAFVNRLIGETRTKAKKTAKEELDAAAATEREKADLEKAEQDGELQKVIDGLKADKDKLQSDLKAKELTDRRRAALTKHKLPDDLLDRLKGETDEELDADAQALTKLFGKREVVDTEIGNDGTRQPAAPKIPTHRFGSTPKVPWPDQQVPSEGS